MDWRPPASWRRIRAIDSHAGGEPFRLVLEGFPELAGATLLERRRDARERFDSLRRALMWEPRGHADMYGGVLTAPVAPGSDLGVVFLHNEGYSTMCGHGVIALATVAVETGLVERREGETAVRIDTPAGTVSARVGVAGGRSGEVRFVNVPSFALALDREVEVAGLGRVRYDLAFGGAFYAYVRAAELGLQPDAAHLGRLIEAGRAIRAAVAATGEVAHPLEPELSFLYGVLFVGPARGAGRHSRHVCVFADGEVDRSPTGTGVSGRLALLHARAELERDEAIAVESIVGSVFTGRITAPATVGPHAAVVPEIGGRAWITGRHEFLLDPDDPLGEGFLLR